MESSILVRQLIYSETPQPSVSYACQSHVEHRTFDIFLECGMKDTESQTTGKSSVCSTRCSSYEWRKHQRFVLLVLYQFLHKGAIKGIPFPCHDAIAYWNVSRLLLSYNCNPLQRVYGWGLITISKLCRNLATKPLGPLLFTWFNINPRMDTGFPPLYCSGWKY